MNKQTAVDFLLDNMHYSTSTKWKDIIKQAKEMEKEQIIFAHVDSCNTMNCNKTDKEKLKCSCAQYFWEQNFK